MKFLGSIASTAITALFVLVVSGSLAGLLGCAHRMPRPDPIRSDASRAMSRAVSEQRSGREGWRERAREAARSALESEPGWVAPARFLDDLMREDGLGHLALAERQAELRRARDAGAPRAEQARLVYLIGRLEGRDGVPRFELARRMDPALGWAHHGVAWMTFAGGDAAGALGPGEAALSVARDPSELAAFTVAMARYQLELGDAPAAIARMLPLLDHGALESADRLTVELWLARAEMECEEAAWLAQGFWRGIRLLAEHDLESDQLVPLVRSMQRVARLGGSGQVLEGATHGLVEELELALASRAGETRDRLRAGLLADRGTPSFLLELDRVRTGGAARGPARRAALLAQGRAGEVLGDWQRALPAMVLDAAGMPLREELAELVRVARTEPVDAGALADALLAAGWFQEARGWAAWMARSNADEALAVDRRALSGRAVIETIRRILDGIDRGVGLDDSGEPIGDLDQLLEVLQVAFSRLEAGLRTEHRSKDGTDDLVASPRTGMAPIAEVVHPGPRFSVADEVLGLGSAGTPVPGLAARFAELGRFGLFGVALGGGGPDGSVLRLLATEQREGSHLGVPYSGTVAWCEGVDVPSRPARRGARIVGAALHEGYWIDIDGVRDELELWRSLEARFRGADGRRRARAVLAAQGPCPADAALLAGENRRRSEFVSLERRRAYAPQRQADRVRLAVLLDRWTDDGTASEGARRDGMTLEELLEVTAAHEEGHLTERTRFLPLWSHPLQLLGVLFEAGFSPWRVSRRLEYRAQLIALAVVEDPRIVLAECIDALEGGGSETPHAEAFGALLTDWLEVLSERIDEFPRLDPTRYLIHQLHHLDPEEVRDVSLTLAKRRDLVGLDS